MPRVTSHGKRGGSASGGAGAGAGAGFRRRRRPDDHNDDDSSVDSHGNIRGLIDYDYDEAPARPPPTLRPLGYARRVPLKGSAPAPALVQEVQTATALLHAPPEDLFAPEVEPIAVAPVDNVDAEIADVVAREAVRDQEVVHDGAHTDVNAGNDEDDEDDDEEDDNDDNDDNDEDDDEDDDEDEDLEEEGSKQKNGGTPNRRRRPPPRRAAMKASKRIARIARKERNESPATASTSTTESPLAARRPAAAGEKRASQSDRERKTKRARRTHDDDDDDDDDDNVEDDESESEVRSRRRTALSRQPTSQVRRVKRNAAYRDDDDDDDDNDDEEDEQPTNRRHARRSSAPRRKRKSHKDDDDSESSDESETLGSIDTDEEEDDDDDSDDHDTSSSGSSDDDDDDDDDGRAGGRRGRSSSAGSFELLFASQEDPMQPRKYKLKHEPTSVRRFVKLLQKNEKMAGQEGHIDTDIAYFKSLDEAKQNKLLTALAKSVAPPAPGVEREAPLKLRLLQMVADHPELQRVAMSKYMQLATMEPGASDHKLEAWVRGFARLPLGVYTDMPVHLADGPDKCSAFLSAMRDRMDAAIYGHDDVKMHVIEFVSQLLTNPAAGGRVLVLNGPPGVGKTAVVATIAAALRRPFARFALGGLADASTLTGHAQTWEGSTWGRLADALMAAQCMDPLLFFDEADKVSETTKGDEVQNVLVHLTDETQNRDFEDAYFAGVKLDMSRTLIVLGTNDLTKLSPILRDRMFLVRVPGYEAAAKLTISTKHLLPAALDLVHLTEKVSVPDDVVKYIIATYTGQEEGVRELKRCLETVARRINVLRMWNDPKRVPFAIKGFALPFIVTREHVDMFLKRKEPPIDASIQRMWT